DDPLGCSYYIDGSGETKIEDAGCAVGTSVEVSELFYNTPARMKFLKKDVTEGNAVASLMDRLALANPSIAFELIRDKKRTLQTFGSGDLLSAVRTVCGAQVASGMIEVDYHGEGIRVSGVISRPSVARATRSLQTFFINSRFVRSRTCAGAVEEAYKNRLMTGRFPACVLNIEINCSQVDVNVHPAKLEVRFSDERLIYNTVYSACMETLAEHEKRIAEPKQQKITHFSVSDFNYSNNQITFNDVPVKPTTLQRELPPQKPAFTSITAALGGRERTPLVFHDDTPSAFEKPVIEAAKKQEVAKSSVSSRKYMLDIECDEPKNSVEREKPVIIADIAEPIAEKQPVIEPIIEKIEPIAPPEIETVEETVIEEAVFEQEIPKAEPKPEYRIIGEIFDTYILLEQQNRFIMIDKHAAHERFIYNSIKHLGKDGDRQLLLVPKAITLSRDEYFALTENPQALETLGVIAEDFGEGTMLVREVPMLLDGFDLAQLLGEVAKKLLANKNDPTPEMLDELLYSVSCRAAVMAGKRSAMPELEKLADMVLGEDGVRHCPHGRPVLVSLSKYDVEKMFGRMG
ncbi:MAG: hypothetical protein J5968_00235, partial [Oscillospiraceae bacterium]|nr:hypothetical protein [Oscillospiraceae bacterium]